MDTILYNGKIYTQDKAYPSCSAIAIKNGVIAAMGSNSEILALSKDNTEKIDLKQRRVLPGFEDSHLHLLFYAIQASAVNLAAARSLEDVKSLCGEKVQWAKQNGKWIQGVSFNQDDWDIKKLPTRHDLDRISTEVPISIRRACYHISVCNTKALEILGLMENISDEAKINMGFNEDGTPDGLIKEDLQNIITEAQPLPTKDEIKDLIILGLNHAASKGITQVHSDDFMVLPGDDGETIMNAYKELAAEGKLPIRVYQQCLLWEENSLERFLKRGHKTGDDYGFYRIGPFKIIGDGSLGAHTAYMRKPYLNEPGTCGLARYTDEQLYEICKTAHNNGMQLAIHCIGDASLEQALNALKKLQLDYTRTNCRHGIVHCQIMDNKQHDMFHELNLLAYVQPIFLRCDMNIVDECVGSELAKQSYNWRRYEDTGVHQSGGSDCPVEAFDILPNIEYAVTRTNPDTGKSWYPENKVTLKEAIRIFTYEGAYASFSESIRGSLSVGKYADLVVLDKDIFEVPENQIHNINVDITMVGGKIAYSR